MPHIVWYLLCFCSQSRKNYFCSGETLFPDIVRDCTVRKIIFPFHVLFLTKKYVEDQWWIILTPKNLTFELLLNMPDIVWYLLCFCSDETLFPNIVKYCTFRKIIFPFHVLFLKNIYVEDQWWILFTPNNKKLSCF